MKIAQRKSFSWRTFISVGTGVITTAGVATGVGIFISKQIKSNKHARHLIVPNNITNQDINDLALNLFMNKDKTVTIEYKGETHNVYVNPNFWGNLNNIAPVTFGSVAEAQAAFDKAWASDNWSGLFFVVTRDLKISLTNHVEIPLAEFKNSLIIQTCGPFATNTSRTSIAYALHNKFDASASLGSITIDFKTNESIPSQPKVVLVPFTLTKGAESTNGEISISFEDNAKYSL